MCRAPLRPGQPATHLGRAKKCAPTLAAAGLLLALLAGPAPRAAAQALVPGVRNLPAGSAGQYPPNADYRRLHVRAVLLTQLTTDRDEPGQPPTRQLISYQEYDAQGRLLRQYGASEGRPLERRIDLDYDAAGELASAATYVRPANAADTTRLGRVWVPDSFTQYPPLPGTGTSAVWDERTGDWLVVKRFRRWQSHDTTYLATTAGRTGRLAEVQRGYYAGRGQRQRRDDELRYQDSGELTEATYSYSRLNADKKQVLEVGRLSFQSAQSLRDYGPGISPGRPTAQTDEHARHAAGTPQPSITLTYDAHGWLLTQESMLGTRTSYEHDADGRYTQSRTFRGDELAQRTRYTYLPSGLPARTSTFGKRDVLRMELVYEYRYF